MTNPDPITPAQVLRCDFCGRFCREAEAEFRDVHCADYRDGIDHTTVKCRACQHRPPTTTSRRDDGGGD